MLYRFGMDKKKSNGNMRRTRAIEEASFDRITSKLVGKKRGRLLKASHGEKPHFKSLPAKKMEKIAAALTICQRLA